MAVHDLKIWPEFFDAIERGDKTFELRKDDRGFRAGDKLLLREWQRHGHYYTGREMVVDVPYLISGIGLAPGVVCMSIRRDANAEHTGAYRSAETPNNRPAIINVPPRKRM